MRTIGLQHTHAVSQHTRQSPACLHTPSNSQQPDLGTVQHTAVQRPRPHFNKRSRTEWIMHAQQGPPADNKCPPKQHSRLRYIEMAIYAPSRPCCAQQEATTTGRPGGSTTVPMSAANGCIIHASLETTHAMLSCWRCASTPVSSDAAVKCSRGTSPCSTTTT